MARRLLLLAALAGASLATASAQTAGLSVTSPGGDTLYVTPGATVGFGLRVANEGVAARTLALSVTPPDGWTPLLTRPAVTVEAGASALQIVSVRVPEGIAPGLYPVDLAAQDSLGAARVRRVVRVATVSEIRVEIVGAPHYVVAGETYRAEALVSNLGNAPALVDLDLRTTYRHRVDASERQVTVAPGGAAVVQMAVATREPPGAVTDRLRVIAVNRAAPDSTLDGAWADATARVQVVPRTGRRLARETWPLTMSVASVSAGADVVPLVGASGEVAFDAEGRHVAALDLGDLGRESASIFAGVPRLWATYAGPWTEAAAGRGLFPLTPAATSSALGLGARLSLARGASDATLQLRRAIRPRAVSEALAQPLDTDLGASLGRSLGGARLSLNTILGTGYRPGAVATARAEGTLGGVSLDAEAGTVPLKLAPVWSVRASGERGRLSMHGSARRHDAFQPGRSADYLGRSVGAYLDLDTFTASGLWSDRRRGEGRTPLDGLAEVDREESGYVSLRYRFPYADSQVHMEGGGDYRGYERSLALGHLTRARRVALARLQTTFIGVDRTRFSAEVRHGRTWDPATGQGRPAWGLRLHYGYSEARWGAAWQVEVLKGLGELSAAAPRRFTVGADTYWNAGRLALRGRARAGHVRVESFSELPGYRSATLSLQAEAELALPRGLALVGKGFVFWGLGEPETHTQLALRVPIGMPLPYSVDRPEVRGRFVDEATGEGVGGVLVFLGPDRVLTGGDGVFRFPTETGGYLVADRATLGADYVPVTPLPVFVQPDEPVEVVVARRVVLRGALRQMQILGTGPRADTTDVGGLPFAVIEAEGRGGRHRTVTDLEGRFAFDDLAAGAYTLRVVQATLPARHRLEQATLAVAVEDEAEVLWRVLPERAPIQILDQGRLGGPPSGGALRLGGSDG